MPNSVNTLELLRSVRILAVDDEDIVRDFFREALSRRCRECFVCADGEEAQKILSANNIDIVITDIRMPNVDGSELLRWILGHHPTVPVIMLTAYGTIEGAVEAMRTGAFDYLCKPVTDMQQLDLVLTRAMTHRALLVENQILRSELRGKYNFDRIVGPGRKMQHIFELLARVAPTQATVLIQGASGTGKELIARAVHENSPRARKPFVKVNCAALPEGLIESELFGHERGAFTGAIRTTRGKFEAADGGTLLLDEIGELPLGLQAKLLRVLQEREFQRVGSVDNVRVDVRLIATTNVDLEAAVAESRFREDLFYRLNVIPVKLPPLSERREDILVLARHFMQRFARLHHRRIDGISDKSMRYLYNAPWNGNVRELENAVERAVIMCGSSRLELADFFIDSEPPPDNHIQQAPPETNVVEMTLAELEKKHIMSTLSAMNGHRARAAERLAISIRTLRNKLNEYRKSGENV